MVPFLYWNLKFYSLKKEEESINLKIENIPICYKNPEEPLNTHSARVHVYLMAFPMVMLFRHRAVGMVYGILEEYWLFSKCDKYYDKYVD